MSIPISKRAIDANPKSMPASEEIINMLAQVPNVLEFNPSEKARQRVWELVNREKQGDLTEDEKYELEHYAQIEHVIRRYKHAHRRGTNTRISGAVRPPLCDPPGRNERVAMGAR